MDSFQSLKSQAQQKLNVADHLLSTTYNLIKEPKLLISVMENIFQAMECAMDALLEYEKNFKSLGSYSSTFQGKFDMFRRKVATKYNISPEILNFITELASIIDEHKKSTVEFSRKQKLVMTDNDYNLRTLAPDDVKKKLAVARKYIDQLFHIAKFEV